jgi:hypothetical protein
MIRPGGLTDLTPFCRSGRSSRLRRGVHRLPTLCLSAPTRRTWYGQKAERGLLLLHLCCFDEPQQHLLDNMLQACDARLKPRIVGSCNTATYLGDLIEEIF